MKDIIGRYNGTPLENAINLRRIDYLFNDKEWDVINELLLQYRDDTSDITIDNPLDGFVIDESTQNISYNLQNKTPYFNIKNIKSGRRGKWSVVSLFHESFSDILGSHNPFILAFKGYNGWHFENKTHDLFMFARCFVHVIKKQRLIENHYDTIIIFQKSKFFNDLLLLIAKFMNCNVMINRSWDYVNKEYALKWGLNRDMVKEDGYSRSVIKKKFLNFLSNMPTQNFQYKYVEHEYRKYLTEYFIELYYHEDFCDKNVLVIDDEFECTEVINTMYDVKKLTTINLYNERSVNIGSFILRYIYENIKCKKHT